MKRGIHRRAFNNDWIETKLLITNFTNRIKGEIGVSSSFGTSWSFDFVYQFWFGSIEHGVFINFSLFVSNSYRLLEMISTLPS